MSVMMRIGLTALTFVIYSVFFFIEQIILALMGVGGLTNAGAEKMMGPQFYSYNIGSSGSRVGVFGNFRGLEACM